MKKIFFLLAIVILIVTLFIYTSVSEINRFFGLPDLSSVTKYEPISSIELYDYRNNFVGFLQAEEDRKVVSIKHISPYLKRAVLAIEDKDFYDHGGIDPVGIVRAFFVNIKAGRIVEGGSTITQQLVKNLLIPEQERGRTYTRKIKEILLAIELEQKVSKDKILELYLNQVFWGRRAYGALRAAQRYFGKDVSNLKLSEAAYLAGLLQAPSALSGDFKAAKERQKLVLSKMLQFGFITKDQYKAALKEKLYFNSTPGNLEAYPYYFTYVLKYLKERFNLDRLKGKGYKVYTSIDPVAQSTAERILNEEIKNAPYGVTQFALAGIDVKTAQVRVLVGGVGNFWEHQWNRATNAHTIGSAFKPFTYVTAFKEGIIDPDTKIKDAKIALPDGVGMLWTPKNFDGKYWGDITVRRALTFSRNIPAVKVASRVGIEKIIETAKACGIESTLDPHLAVALGSCALTPLETASAYSTFARGGIYIKPILVRRIEDPQGRIIEKNDPVPKSAINPYAVASLVSILQDVVKMGTGTLAKLPDRPVAGKTGTSDKSRDVWFIGFTPDFSAAIWGGNDNYQPIHGKHVTGGAIVARVWKIFMEEYYKEKQLPPGNFPDDPPMKEYLVDPLTGLLATEYTPNPVKRRFYNGTEPKEYAPVPKGAKKLGALFRFLASPGRKNKFVEIGGEFEADEKLEKISNEEKQKILNKAKTDLNINTSELTEEEIEQIYDKLVDEVNVVGEGEKEEGEDGTSEGQTETSSENLTPIDSDSNSAQEENNSKKLNDTESENITPIEPPTGGEENSKLYEEAENSNNKEEKEN